MARTPKPYRHYAKFAMLLMIKRRYSPAMLRTIHRLREDFHAIALDEYFRGLEKP